MNPLHFKRLTTAPFCMIFYHRLSFKTLKHRFTMKHLCSFKTTQVDIPLGQHGQQDLTMS